MSRGTRFSLFRETTQNSDLSQPKSSDMSSTHCKFSTNLFYVNVELKLGVGFAYDNPVPLHRHEKFLTTIFIQFLK